MNRLICLAVLLTMSVPSISQETSNWRPKYHFSPEKNWINDPNGLVYYEGLWHLFFQYNPEGDQWGHMSWGHATSTDLMNWSQQALAIPEGEEYIFSGCIVVDSLNTSGLFDHKGGLVALYTGDFHGKKEEQHLAYSSDGGTTWMKYSGNPVIGTPSNEKGDLGVTKDFRDPNVFWYQPTQEWIMAVVLPKQFTNQLYASKNLIDWQWRSDFGNKGDLRKIWECPSLAPVPVVNLDGDKVDDKWLLSISSNGPYDDFVGMQYFVGDFDGKAFMPDEAEPATRYLDFGKDYYAAIPFHNSKRNIMLGWMNNWAYAKHVPTAPWRGQMNLPRELKIIEKGSKRTLLQFPPSEVLNHQNWNTVTQMSQMDLQPTGGISFRASSHFHLHAEFVILNNEVVNIELKTGDKEYSLISYDPVDELLKFDRTIAGEIVADNFPSIESTPLKLSQNKLSLDIFVDGCTMEVFANKGQKTISNLVFPKGIDYEIEFTGGEGTQAKNVVVREWR